MQNLPCTILKYLLDSPATTSKQAWSLFACTPDEDFCPKSFLWEHLVLCWNFTPAIVHGVYIHYILGINWSCLPGLFLQTSSCLHCRWHRSVGETKRRSCLSTKITFAWHQLYVVLHNCDCCYQDFWSVFELWAAMEQFSNVHPPPTLHFSRAIMRFLYCVGDPVCGEKLLYLQNPKPRIKAR